MKKTSTSFRAKDWDDNNIILIFTLTMQLSTMILPTIRGEEEGGEQEENEA